MDKVKEMVELAKSMETETLEKGDEVMMKIIAIDNEEKSYIFALAGWEPKNYKDRDKTLQAIGLKMHDLMKELKTLILVSDTYFAAFPKEMSPIEQIIMHDLNSGKRRLEHLPPELHKYRGEALVVITSQDEGNKVSMSFIPHKKVDGKVVFDTPHEDYSKHEDNMLSNVWKGWKLK